MLAAVASIGRELVEAFIAADLKCTAPSSAPTRYRPLLNKQLGVRPDGWRNAAGPFGDQGSSQRVGVAIQGGDSSLAWRK
jgi:hypothetical protein